MRAGVWAAAASAYFGNLEVEPAHVSGFSEVGYGRMGAHEVMCDALDHALHANEALMTSIPSPLFAKCTTSLDKYEPHTSQHHIIDERLEDVKYCQSFLSRNCSSC